MVGPRHGPRGTSAARTSEGDSPIFVATTEAVVPEMGQSPTCSFVGPNRLLTVCLHFSAVANHNPRTTNHGSLTD
jgi:hypothetical protein